MKNIYMPGYQGRIFRTDRSHTLLLFMGGADKWLGPWPTTSWDTFYDRYAPQYMELSEYRTKLPTIFLGPAIDFCRAAIIGGHYGEFNYFVSTNQYDEAEKLILKPQCDRVTQYKHCSFDCWYLSERQFITDDIKYAVHFREDATKHQQRLRRFEMVFKLLNNRWGPYRQKWVSES